jgi:predicted DNA-binding transcriptional regulator AlpA
MTLLTRKEAATYLGVSPHMLARLAMTPDRSPPMVKFSSRCIRYDKAELDLWIANHKQQIISNFK